MNVHPTLIARLAEIRQEVAGLLGDIDTRIKPKPDRINPASGKLPGPVWEPIPDWEREPRRLWRINVVDPDDATACVFVHHPYVWDGDIYPLEPDDARRIGMAFLAAADWADRLRSEALAETTTDEEGAA